MFCTVETKRKPLNSLKFRGFHLFAVILRGVTGNRTRDTRIFSPLLYQLSYDTNFVLELPFLSIGIAKVGNFSEVANFSANIFQKLRYLRTYNGEKGIHIGDSSAQT